MKACPTCDLVYNYELLQFCRFDGSRLVNSYYCEDTTQQLLLPMEIRNRNPTAPVDHRTGELKTLNPFR